MCPATVFSASPDSVNALAIAFSSNIGPLGVRRSLLSHAGVGCCKLVRLVYHRRQQSTSIYGVADVNG